MVNRVVFHSSVGWRDVSLTNRILAENEKRDYTSCVRSGPVLGYTVTDDGQRWRDVKRMTRHSLDTSTSRIPIS